MYGGIGNSNQQIRGKKPPFVVISDVKSCKVPDERGEVLLNSVDIAQDTYRNKNKKLCCVFSVRYVFYIGILYIFLMWLYLLS